MIDQMEAFVLEARIKVIVAPRQWGKTTILRLEANYAPDERTLCVFPVPNAMRFFEAKQRGNLVKTYREQLQYRRGERYDLVLVDDFDLCYTNMEPFFGFLPKRIILTSSRPLPVLEELSRQDPDYLYLNYL